MLKSSTRPSAFAFTDCEHCILAALETGFALFDFRLGKILWQKNPGKKASYFQRLLLGCELKFFIEQKADKWTCPSCSAFSAQAVTFS